MTSDGTHPSSDAPDHGHGIEFGFFLDPSADEPTAVLETARLLDLLSGGRFEMGLGAGGFLQAAHAMGAPAWTAGQSLAALEGAVSIMRAMWSGERHGLRFDGRYYTLAGVHPGPAPAVRHQVAERRSRPTRVA